MSNDREARNFRNQGDPNRQYGFHRGFDPGEYGLIPPEGQHPMHPWYDPYAYYFGPHVNRSGGPTNPPNNTAQSVHSASHYTPMVPGSLCAWPHPLPQRASPDRRSSPLSHHSNRSHRSRSHRSRSRRSGSSSSSSSSNDSRKSRRSRKSTRSSRKSDRSHHSRRKEDQSRRPRRSSKERHSRTTEKTIVVSEAEYEHLKETARKVSTDQPLDEGRRYRNLPSNLPKLTASEVGYLSWSSIF